jgi:hypothetical protein
VRLGECALARTTANSTASSASDVSERLLDRKFEKSAPWHTYYVQSLERMVFMRISHAWYCSYLLARVRAGEGGEGPRE